MTELRMAMMLNDHALEWMLKGDYRNAENTLKQSFVAIRNVIHFNDDDARVPTATIPSLPSELPFFPSANSQHQQDCIIHKLCHSDLFIFNRPVYFSRCNIFGDNQYNDLATNHASTLSILCSAIVFFNMALILHLRGIHDDKSSLMRAKYLYMSTFQLMRNLNAASFFFPDILHELYLTSVNNYALICVELNQHKRAQDAAHAMRSIIVSSTIMRQQQRRRQRPGGLLFSEEEWNGFARNIGWILSLSLLPTFEIRCCGAPAA